MSEAVAAVSLVTVSMHAGHMLFLEWSARMAVIMAVAAVAVAARSYRIRRETQQREEQERIRSEMLARQRDQAISRAQVAGELHDSVGHDLTTIIALTQGFADSVEIEELQEVLKDINQVARDGLADTRQAVRTLVQEHEALPEKSDDDGRRFGSRLHTLDELDTVIAHARAAGLAVVSTETGHQRHDPRQDNLCFIISREAITNTLRHASDPSTIVISRDYEQDGTLRISIHDDGRGDEHGQVLGDQQPAIHDHQGMGLRQIGEQCRLMGGSLSCGPSENGGWTVEAILPGTSEKGCSAHD
ncbi:sensor histidine kinase [Bifidobacterium sp. A11]|uniref:sensor histidine kinase n=1 Tax=Bifidobacterium sp. A11 TaxID=1394176 RepID=UPI00155A06DB|nr:histidine kinase [Bifidobacterium sp. A11]